MLLKPISFMRKAAGGSSVTISEEMPVEARGDWEPANYTFTGKTFTAGQKFILLTHQPDGIGVGGCSILSNSATLVTGSDATAGTAAAVEIWQVDVPTGGTGDVVLTPAASTAGKFWRIECTVFDAADFTSVHDASAGQAYAASHSITVDVPADGAVLSCARSQYGGGAFSYDAGAVLNANYSASGLSGATAFENGLGVETGRTITVSKSSADTIIISAVSVS